MSASLHHLSYRNRRARPGEPATSRNFLERAEAAAKVAAAFADAVDREARFPHEAFEVIKAQRLLGVLVSTDLGGEGARAADVADICAILGAACASTGMIYAMHQIKVACLVRHDRGNAWQREFQRKLAAQQWLLASSTTEGMNGGDVRSSEAAIRLDGPKVALVRDASCISYGAYADGIVTTARRADAASRSDQVLLAFHKSDYTLEQTRGWDTLGMRGTCSMGYILRAEGVADQVVPEPYERIHNQTMAPYAHLFWSASWQGIASASVNKARGFVRNAARASGGKMPPGAAHLTRARLTLETLRGAIQAGIATFDAHASEPGGLTTINAQLALNFLKVEASELALQTVMSAMRACGLAGFRNDGDYSMGRYLRDILSAPIMISNDRILANAEAAVLMSEPSISLAL